MATTVSEALGRIVLEAAATGAPSIAPRSGGIPEMIRHEENGLLFAFRDGRDLEQQMRRVLTESELLQHLLDGQQAVLNTRDAVANMEAFYWRVLDGLKAS